jgi:hypothetical protein
MADEIVEGTEPSSRDQVQALLDEGTPQFRRLETLIYETGTDEMKELITEIHVKLGTAAVLEGYSVPPAADGELHPDAKAALAIHPNSGGGGK